MMGDYQVRFCEKLGVRFPLLTRQRLWRTVKQDYVYLNPAENGMELYKGLKEFFRYYNYRKSHQGIGRIHPAELYKKAS